MEIIGVIIVLLYVIGTIKITSLCFALVSSLLPERQRIIKFMIKSACVGIFIFLFLSAIDLPGKYSSLRKRQRYVESTFSIVYIISISSLGVYTLGRDYYLYFKNKKALHKGNGKLKT